MNLKQSIEHIFDTKILDIKKSSEQTISELEIEKKFLLFIDNDIQNGCPLGTKNGNTVVYKVEKILKQLKIEKSHLLFESNCVTTLKGLAFNVEKDYLKGTITIVLN